MALETLKDVTEIDGFEVARFGEVTNPNHFVFVYDDQDFVSFKIQNGPIKENGVNGCQVDTIIETAAIIIEGLDKNFPCDENHFAAVHLRSALVFLKRRKADRETREVEGENKQQGD